jgi:RNA polymerase sigma-70 factor (ECF subfamily)
VGEAGGIYPPGPNERGVLRAPPYDPGGPSPLPAAAPAVAGAPSPGRPPTAYWPEFDREELLRAQAGDPRALGRLFDHYFDRVFSVAHRFTGNREAAEDIVQDVFIKLRRHLGRLQLDRDLAPWLYTVAVHACHDQRRSSWWRMWGRSLPLDHPVVAPALSSHDGDPAHAMLIAEEERRVQAAIGRLAPELRTSVILHDLEGLPHDQIAAITGISHAAARKRHSRALLTLARLLREHETP